MRELSFDYWLPYISSPYTLGRQSRSVRVNLFAGQHRLNLKHNSFINRVKILNSNMHVYNLYESFMPRVTCLTKQVKRVTTNLCLKIIMLIMEFDKNIWKLIKTYVKYIWLQ